ncbi:hypothetical protein EJ05DRAFT_483979 [Pseudovirgaria hyperparasitica]|uniref:Uncharacterized protein n=1 Tax=Pseudovirgaria hyperparasitica TaxID=470096 RepID=A0A6A6WGE1_9PEZI|nr:uncharacterized protein EJ05DRAFT_483979 [Pseudovirgaria hyperparasitica]KAF2760211.1 hypothetical protein EJ05DRAFT_483979 [Pseudovirgaria hyperparasitica]
MTSSYHPNSLGGEDARSKHFSQSDTYYDSRYDSSPRAASSDYPRSYYPAHRGRSRRRRPSSIISSDSSSDSPSPLRTRSRSRRRHHRPRSVSRRRHTEDVATKEEKSWYNKKSLWTGLATIATIASLVPSAMAVKQTGRSARATEKSAAAVTKSARATLQSANATKMSAGASMLGARAAINSGVAQGHMDFDGRYTGPATHMSARKAIDNGGYPPPLQRAVGMTRLS